MRTLQAGEFLIDRFGRWVAKRVGRSIAFRRVPPDTFEANIRAMIAAVRAAGAQPLILVPPLSDSLLERYASTPVYHDILRHIAAEMGVRERGTAARLRRTRCERRLPGR